MDLTRFPGGDLVAAGLRDLARSASTPEAELVLVGAPRLRELGLDVPLAQSPGAEHRLYALLAAEDSETAHARYNALIRRLVSFEHAVAHAIDDDGLGHKLSPDTAPEIEQRLYEGWRNMTPAQKARSISGLSQSVFACALAGVRHRHPEETERQHFLRLAVIVLGADLARRAFPEIDSLSVR